VATADLKPRRAGRDAAQRATEQLAPLVCILSTGEWPDLAGAIASARRFALPVLGGQNSDAKGNSRGVKHR